MGISITGGTQLDYSGFNRKAVLFLFNTQYMSRALSYQSFIDQLTNAFTDKAQYINSIRWYPFSISSFTTLQPINQLKLGGINVKYGSGDSDDVLCQRFGDIQKKVEICHFILQPKYSNFMDYEPYTRAQIYLPFLGFYDLPVNECMGQRVTVSYGVDFDTGIATAYIEVGEDTETTSKRLVMTASGKVGIDVPIGSTNANEIARRNFENGAKLIASGIGLVGGFMVGNVAGGMLAASALTTAMSSGVNAITAQTKEYRRGTITGGQDGMCSPRSVYVVITSTKPLDIGTEEDYRKFKGKPLEQSKMLNTLYGFTIVDKIHLEGFDTALKTEIDEIESLLHEGVIFQDL